MQRWRQHGCCRPIGDTKSSGASAGELRLRAKPNTVLGCDKRLQFREPVAPLQRAPHAFRKKFAWASMRGLTQKAPATGCSERALAVIGDHLRNAACQAFR